MSKVPPCDVDITLLTRRSLVSEETVAHIHYAMDSGGDAISVIVAHALKRVPFWMDKMCRFLKTRDT